MPYEDKTPRLYSLPEAADELANISVWSIRKHIYKGNIHVVRLGRRVAISSQEVARIKREGLPSLVTTIEVHTDTNLAREAPPPGVTNAEAPHSAVSERGNKR